uniref:Uncharacterized protein n=1 Tax=Pristionchus pacificus TaxID=54126 RepID=A0A8R1U360_PRIPA
MRLWVMALVASSVTFAMRVDPERIAARLRIEAEEEADRAMQNGRSRRQLATPKEISIQVTAPLFSSRLFEHGKNAGDNQLPQQLDGIKKIQLKNPLQFYGESHDHVYILANGGIGFEQASKNYKPNVFPGNLRLIAPFWNRNDVRERGTVWYREVLGGRVLERGQSEIRYQYDKTVKVLSAILVTWENMQPLGAAPLVTESTNTFQAAVFITDQGAFANFIYSNIGWTQGAEAGFNRGNGKTHYALPTSGTGNIMYLEEYGNTGIPGEWMFELGKVAVIRCKAGIKGDTCDAECASGEWGEDCAKCCHCSGSDQTCNPLTGECKAGCGACWSGIGCATRVESCGGMGGNRTCAVNALSFTDTDRCGEILQRCQCLEGYHGDGYKQCDDVDECSRPGVCHENAVCTNTPGKYFCQCKEGFTGDGVKSCQSSFLFSSSNHQSLPSGKASKISYRLRSPQVWFGQEVDQLTITSTGLIGLDGSSSDLHDPSTFGVAPFYSPKIDTSRGGRVTVAEVTDSDVLTRVTRMIRDAIKDPSFISSGALIVTSTNVSTTESSPSRNTYQSVIVTGTNSLHEPRSYCLFLFDRLEWSEGAESVVQSGDSTTSIALPGSGTEGVLQLKQLSNVGQPGLWMYQIDTPSISGCPLDDHLPPFCDELAPRNVQPAPRRPTPSVVEFAPMNIVPQIIGNPGQLSPVQPKLTTQKTTTTTSTTTPSPPSPSVPLSTSTSLPHETKTPSRQLPVFQSTPHKPLVSLSDEDIENIPPDAFEMTLPPFVTVIPEIFTPTQPNGEKQREKELPHFQKSPSPTSTTSSTPFSSSTEKTTTTITEKVVEVPKEKKLPAPVQIDFNDEETIEKMDLAVEEEGLPLMEDDHIEEEETKPIFVFTTTLKPTPPPPKPRHPSIVTGGKKAASPSSTETPLFHSDAEASASKLAILIPAAIVVAWIVILLVIACVVLIKKQSAARRLRSSYGPSYAFRGATSYGLNRPVYTADSSYEDHLEKAARLSSEMTAYNQRYTYTGRY